MKAYILSRFVDEENVDLQVRQVIEDLEKINARNANGANGH